MDLFEFDPAKNRSNIAKHGVDFVTAARIWDGLAFEREDNRKDYGERRLIALGEAEGRVLVVVYTWREARRRLISARKGNSDEQEIYRATVARIQSKKED